MGADRVEFVDEPAIRATVSAVFESLNGTLKVLLPAARIEHVGSTSIPGAVTKGDLDICVQVPASAFPEADRILSERFARNVGSHQSASLSSFIDDSLPVPVGVQLVALGGNEDFFFRWRDLLRSSPQVLQQYDQLKRRWHGQSHEEYREAKSKFIEQMLQSPLAGG
jgi:GrpB-like predicted nucleotidyltransferase (UPF0157 family)